MKTNAVEIMCLALLTLVSGCAAPEFQPYSGNAVRVGTGGTSRVVDGMTVWEGTPPRRFQILGAIEEEGGGRATARTVLQDTIPVAKAHGADALIVVAAGQRLSGVDLDTGTFVGRPKIKVAAIKYLP